MQVVTPQDFQANQARYLEQVARGLELLIKGKTDAFKVVKATEEELLATEELVITPELEARMARARMAYQRGDFVSCSTKKELHDFLDSL